MIPFIKINCCCRKRVSASVMRGGLVRTGGGVRATLAPTGRTGAFKTTCTGTTERTGTIS